MSWERWAAAAGVAFVVLYVAAFSLGVEVGATDREIREHYADSGSRRNEAIAFFLIPLAVSFLGFLVLALWMLATSAVLARRGSPAPA